MDISQQMTTIVMIGGMGSGKSSTIQSLVHHPELETVFKSSSGANACTNDTVAKSCFWKNTNDPVFVIDTPGLHEGA